MSYFAALMGVGLPVALLLLVLFLGLGLRGIIIGMLALLIVGILFCLLWRPDSGEDGGPY
jgi:hypothetical protein